MLLLVDKHGHKGTLDGYHNLCVKLWREYVIKYHDQTGMIS